MPQDNFPITITTAETTYTVNAAEELQALPDSVKTLIAPPISQQQVAFSQEEIKAMSKPRYEVSPQFMVGALMLFALILYKAWQALQQIEEEREVEENTGPVSAGQSPQCLIYRGEELEFSTEEVKRICSRYNPFFNKLDERNQHVFINRLGEFMFSKDFYIMSSHGYKEMPILVSAAAIQISYGLDDYLFPYFSRIIIHPEEYIAFDPLRVLVGNVQGRTITLSWKHFLEDYKNPTDGKNVGLHEMAHALQVQHLFQNHGFRNGFKKEYEYYDKIDDEVLLAESTRSSALFDKNALSNPNEFWATCVELFFEKPRELKEQYPRLYKSLCMVLNQDTAAMLQ